MAGHLNETTRASRDGWPISSTEGIPRAVDLLDRLRAQEEEAIEAPSKDAGLRDWWSLLSVTAMAMAGQTASALSGLPTLSD